MRSRSVGLLIGVAAFAFFAVYVHLALYNWFIPADIALAIGAGLITGLVIYAITNHRSKREKDLVQIVELSQKAIIEHQWLHHYLSKYLLRLRSPEFRIETDRELTLTTKNSWIDFTNTSKRLLIIDHKTLSNLEKIDKIYENDSFELTIMRIMTAIFDTHNEEECSTCLIKFDNKINELLKILEDINDKAEYELKILRSSLI